MVNLKIAHEFLACRRRANSSRLKSEPHRVRALTSLHPLCSIPKLLRPSTPNFPMLLAQSCLARRFLRILATKNPAGFWERMSICIRDGDARSTHVQKCIFDVLAVQCLVFQVNQHDEGENVHHERAEIFGQ